MYALAYWGLRAIAKVLREGRGREEGKEGGEGREREMRRGGIDRIINIEICEMASNSGQIVAKSMATQRNGGVV